MQSPSRGPPVSSTERRTTTSTTESGDVAFRYSRTPLRILLLPGLFVTVVIHQADQQRLPVVPAAAVQRTRDGVQVYLVGDGDRVEQRNIELGPQVGNGYAVTSGLQDGEMVIVSGLQKVKPGMVVKTSGTDGKGQSGSQAPSGIDTKEKQE